MALNMNWMRQNAVDILQYLPEFLSKDSNFSGVGDACSTEHEVLRLALQDLFEQFFVTTATWGLSYWEKVLAITTLASDNYESRRQRILMRLQYNKTSTAAFMQELAAKYYASTATVKIVQDPANYAFSIVANAIPYEPTELYNAIQTYKPAHLAASIIHLLETGNEVYFGGVVCTSGIINVKPFLGFNLTISNSPEYTGGVVVTSGIINVK